MENSGSHALGQLIDLGYFVWGWSFNNGQTVGIDRADVNSPAGRSSHRSGQLPALG